jgi:prephenate dehydrogenase
MMLDVLLTNADNVSDLIRAYSARMTELADLIASRDEAALRSLLQAAAKQRRGVWH